MTERNNAEDVLSQMERERKLIAEELPELNQRDARMQESARKRRFAGTCAARSIEAGCRLATLPRRLAFRLPSYAGSWKANAHSDPTYWTASPRPLPSTSPSVLGRSWELEDGSWSWEIGDGRSEMGDRRNPVVSC